MTTTTTKTKMARLGHMATVLLLLATTTTRTTTTNAFSIHPAVTRASAITTSTTTARTGRRSSCTPGILLRMSDQWDDEVPTAVTSYDDATRGMLEQQEQKELEAMGGYDDIVPGVSVFGTVCS
jgi:hypothetical protein